MTDPVLRRVLGVPFWDIAGAVTNPMTALGDLIIGGAAGSPTRLGIGFTGQPLTVVAGAPAWGQLVVLSPDAQLNASPFFESGDSGIFSTRLKVFRAGVAAGVRAQRYNGTAASPSDILAAETMGAFGMGGFANGAFAVSAQMLAAATENWGAAARGTRVQVTITPNGTTTENGSVLFDQDSSANFGVSSTLLPTFGEATDDGVRANGRIKVIRAQGGGPFFSFVAVNGTLSAPTAVAAAATLGAMDFRGWDGVNQVRQGANIRAIAESLFSATNTASRIEFLTAPTGSVNPLVRLTINQAGAVLASAPLGGIGYGTGAGGAVTQATNKATGVTSNTATTAITMNNAALAAGATVSFTFTNSMIAATDTVIVHHASVGTQGAYAFTPFPAAGSCVIAVKNDSAGSLSEAIVLRVTVIKSVSA